YSDQISKLAGTGFIALPGEKGVISSVTFSSAKWEGRAPEDYFLVRCYIKNSALNVNTDEIHQELCTILNLRGKYNHAWVHTWNNCLPQYLVGHCETMEKLSLALENSPGVYLCGSSYHGVGLPDCIRSSKKAVSELLK